VASQTAEKEFVLPGDTKRNRFLYFVQLDLSVHKMESEFEGSRDTSKYRILDLVKFAFSEGRMAKYKMAGPVNRLEHRSFALALITSCAGQKADKISQGRQPVEKSLVRPRLSYIFVRPEGRQWVRRPFDSLKHRFFDFTQVAF
jgi:hypothetical protein